jgi:uncharacterized membrane protein
MSYAVESRAAAAAPAARRPVTVTLASALLALMAVVGLGYAVATLAVVPGTLDRFRDATQGRNSADVDGYVTGVWLAAALATVLAIILVALYVVLALGLRRGSNAARIATWVVCGLGLVFGCGSALAVAAQRSGDGNPGTLGVALSGAYPGHWIGLNVALAIAQMVGYLVVAMLLLAGTREHFRAARAPVPPQSYGALPTYGATNPYPAAGNYSQAPPQQPPQSGPDHDYWSRPSS